MDVDIVTNAVAGGWDPRRLAEGLGGSEECVTLLAEALARRGLRVAVYASLPGDAPFTHRGVAWRPRGAFDPAAPRHALIGFKEPGLWLFPARAEVAVHWSSDAEPALKPALLGRVGHVVALSAAHAERLAWVPRERLRVISHGIGAPFWLPGPRDERSALPRESGAAGLPWREREPILLACSSPDRGLERLLLDWPRLLKAHGELRLLVTYGFQRIPPSPWRAHMESLLAQRGILYLGCLGEEALAERMRSARYWVHPLNAPAAELFCLSAVKAQALGALPVTQHVADSGLRDTVREYIPYSAFLGGSTAPQPNPAARGDLPLSWDEVVARWWLPLLEGNGKSVLQDTVLPQGAVSPQEPVPRLATPLSQEGAPGGDAGRMGGAA
jgi:hypothetical protein